MSEFNDVIDWLKEYHKANFDSCSNQKVKQWSTTSYASYEEMLEALANTEDLNQELAKLYVDSRDDKEARNWAKSSGKELQLQFMNAVKASLRRKFIQTEEPKEASGIMYDRYAANERREAEKILDRFQKWVNSRVG